MSILSYLLDDESIVFLLHDHQATSARIHDMPELGVEI